MKGGKRSSECLVFTSVFTPLFIFPPLPFFHPPRRPLLSPFFFFLHCVINGCRWFSATVKRENGGGRQGLRTAQKDAILECPSRPPKATKEGLDPPLEPAASLAFRFFPSLFKNRFECVFGILSPLLRAKTEVSPHKRKRSPLVGSRCFFLGRRRPLIVAIDAIGRLTARPVSGKTRQIDPKSRFLPEIAWNSRSGTPIRAKNIVFFLVFQSVVNCQRKIKRFLDGEPGRAPTFALIFTSTLHH